MKMIIKHFGECSVEVAAVEMKSPASVDNLIKALLVAKKVVWPPTKAEPEKKK